MARKPKEYKRLPGRGRRSKGASFGLRNSLWLGPDHILSVSNAGYTEDYQRFYYRDVQAILAHRTAAGVAMSAALGFLAIASLVLVLVGELSKWPLPGTVTAGISAGMFLFFLLVHWLRGPTCACFLRTAVQTVQLHSIQRMRTARKAIRLMRVPIEAAQGALSAAEAEQFAQAVAAAPPTPFSRANGSRLPKPYRGMAHHLLFVVLLFDLCHSCARFFTGGLVMFFLSLALFVALAFSLVLALVRQAGTDLPPLIKRLTWGGFVYFCAIYMAGSVHATFMEAANAQKGTDPWARIIQAASQSVFDSPFELFMLSFSVACTAPIGIAGLLLMLRRPAGPAHAPPPLPPGSAAVSGDGPRGDSAT